MFNTVNKKVGRLRNLSHETKVILSFFEVKNILSINDIKTMLYELHGVKKPRYLIYSTLNNLIIKGILKRIESNKEQYTKYV